MSCNIARVVQYEPIRFCSWCDGWSGPTRGSGSDVYMEHQQLCWCPLAIRRTEHRPAIDKANSLVPHSAPSKPPLNAHQHWWVHSGSWTSRTSWLRADGRWLGPSVWSPVDCLRCPRSTLGSLAEEDAELMLFLLEWMRGCVVCEQLLCFVLSCLVIRLSGAALGNKHYPTVMAKCVDLQPFCQIWRVGLTLQGSATSMKFSSLMTELNQKDPRWHLSQFPNTCFSVFNCP